MHKAKIISFILSLFVLSAHAQSVLLKPDYLNYDIDSTTKNKILTSLDTLFAQIKRNKIHPSLIDKDNAWLTTRMVEYLSGKELNKKLNITDFYKKELINLYPISSSEYWITVAYVGCDVDKPPVIRLIVNLVAKQSENQIVFSTPLRYLTKSWKTEIIGNITYYTKDRINRERANMFDKRNTKFATIFGSKPEKLNFYLCTNFQEILQLQGNEYVMNLNGMINDGYGVFNNTIFGVMGNEDFSHDLFHHYTEKFRGDVKINLPVEEGIAYSWGNAFYANKSGEMIGQKELVEELRKYLTGNPKTNMLDLYHNNPKIFKNYPPKVTVKSTICSLLSDEVERVKGMEGIKALIKCGPGDDNFFKKLNEIVSIDQTNFDKEVRRLIREYR